MQQLIPRSDVGQYHNTLKNFKIYHDGDSIILHDNYGILLSTKSGILNVGDKTIHITDSMIIIDNQIYNDNDTIDIKFNNCTQKYYLMNNPFEMSLVQQFTTNILEVEIQDDMSLITIDNKIANNTFDIMANGQYIRFYVKNNPFEMIILKRPMFNTDNGSNFYELEDNNKIIYEFDYNENETPDTVLTNIPQLKKQANIKGKDMYIKHIPRSKLSKYRTEKRLHKVYDSGDKVNSKEDVYVINNGYVFIGEKVTSSMIDNSTFITDESNIKYMVDNSTFIIDDKTIKYYVKTNPFQMGIVEQAIKKDEYGFNYIEIENDKEIIHMFELKKNSTVPLYLRNIDELKHQADIKGKEFILRYNSNSPYSRTKRSFNLIRDGANIVNKPKNGLYNSSTGTFIIGDKTITDEVNLNTTDITFADGSDRYYISQNPFEMNVVEKPLLNNNGTNFIEIEDDSSITYTFDLKDGLTPLDYIINMNELIRQAEIKGKIVKLGYCPRSKLSKFSNRMFRIYKDHISNLPTEDIYINEPNGTLTLGNKIINFDSNQVSIDGEIISDIDTVDITFGNDIRRYYIKNNPIEIGIVERPVIDLNHGSNFTETETNTYIKYEFIVNYNTKTSQFLTNLEELNRIADIKNKELKLKFIPRTKLSKYFGYKRDYKVFNNNSIIDVKPLIDVYMFNNSGTIQLGNKTVIYDEDNINIDGVNIPNNQPVEFNFGNDRTTLYFEHGSLSCGVGGTCDDPIVDQTKSIEIIDTIDTKLITVNTNLMKTIVTIAEQLDFKKNKV